MQSRYYDPETGRFINCDDVDYIGLSDTFTGWNAFAYCENDPVNCVDPEGLVKSKRVTPDKLARVLTDLFILTCFIVKKFGKDGETADIKYLKINSCGMYFSKVKINKSSYIFMFGTKKSWEQSAKLMNSENSGWYSNYTYLFFETTSKAIETKEALSPSFYIASDATLIYALMKDFAKSNKYKKIYTAIWNNNSKDELYAFYIKGKKDYAGVYKFNLTTDKISKVTI